MFNYRITVHPFSTDLFQFPSPGKVSTVRIELLYHGFAVNYYNGYYVLGASHDRDTVMTLFVLKYADLFGITVDRI